MENVTQSYLYHLFSQTVSTVARPRVKRCVETFFNRIRSVDGMGLEPTSRMHAPATKLHQPSILSELFSRTVHLETQTQK